MALETELREQKQPEKRLKVLEFRSRLIEQGRKLEETLPRTPEWRQTADYPATVVKMIRLMKEDEAAYRKFVEVLRPRDRRDCLRLCETKSSDGALPGRSQGIPGPVEAVL